MSVAGNFNAFFFAVHLMDIAICFKTLGTILQSVTHNGKQVRRTVITRVCVHDQFRYFSLQLVLTVLLTSIVVYLYTVLAFNFFRKFYNQGEEDEPDFKCHDMATVSLT